MEKNDFQNVKPILKERYAKLKKKLKGSDCGCKMKCPCKENKK